MVSVLNTMMRQSGPSFCDESVIPLPCRMNSHTCRHHLAVDRGDLGRGRAFFQGIHADMCSGDGMALDSTPHPIPAPLD